MYDNRLSSLSKICKAQTEYSEYLHVVMNRWTHTDTDLPGDSRHVQALGRYWCWHSRTGPIYRSLWDMSYQPRWFPWRKAIHYIWHLHCCHNLQRGGQSSALPWGQTGPQGWCRPRRRWPRRRRQRRRPAERTGSWSPELWSYTAPEETVERLQWGWKSKMFIFSI